MKILLALAVLLTFSILLAHGGLLEFRKMIKQVTEKHAFPSYTTYGCWCGLGGKGMPKDATDWCCQNHDCCYSQLNDKCSPKTGRYKFTYKDEVLACEGNGCEKQICECDKIAVLCMKRNLDTYNKSYRFYPNWKCSRSGPKC
uniref:Phospholipase A2 n=1 Tax=Sphenodon punctatus TaxID=8508 RepID=A0A8D0G2X5_SPHPU